jgi:hypothetical protein
MLKKSLIAIAIGICIGLSPLGKTSVVRLIVLAVTGG